MIASKITNEVKHYNLLLFTQMGAKKEKSMITALQLIIEQATMVQKKDNKKVVTVLSMNIVKTFDHINYARLFHDFWICYIPKIIIQWIASFLSNRVTTVKLKNYISKKLYVYIGIP